MFRRAVFWLVLLCGGCSDGGADGSSAGGASSGATTTTGNATSAGPVAVASGSSSTTGISTSGVGGGESDPEWAPVPWWSGTCAVEYAQRPEHAFPRLEWGSCPGGESACEVLVKNWAPFTNTGQVITDVRRVDGSHEVALFAVLVEGDSRYTVTDVTGAPRAAYRTAPGSSCNLSAFKFDGRGHWIGAQQVDVTSTFVFQPEGQSPSAALATPLNDNSQGQDGGHGLFAIELLYAGAVKVYDRARDEVFVSPPNGTATRPLVTHGGVFYLRAEAVDQPMSWVWDRKSATFRQLIDVRPNLVGDVNSDGVSLAWMEVPPYDFERNAFPPGILYTAPYTTDPAQLVKTARWTELPVPPSAPTVMGSGYFAGVSESTRTIRILRLADGRRWSVPIPNDAFAAPVLSMPYIDETYLFLRVDTEIFRIRMQDLGEGMPGE